MYKGCLKDAARDAPGAHTGEVNLNVWNQEKK